MWDIYFGPPSELPRLVGLRGVLGVFIRLRANCAFARPALPNGYAHTCFSCRGKRSGSDSSGSGVYLRFEGGALAVEAPQKSPGSRADEPPLGLGVLEQGKVAVRTDDVCVDGLPWREDIASAPRT